MVQALSLSYRNPGEHFYSPKRANHVLEFAENFCKLFKGAGAGKPIKLELWEKAHLSAVFGFIDIDGNRQCRESLLIVGKKTENLCLHQSWVFIYWWGMGSRDRKFIVLQPRRTRQKSFGWNQNVWSGSLLRC